MPNDLATGLLKSRFDLCCEALRVPRPRGTHWVDVSAAIIRRHSRRAWKLQFETDPNFGHHVRASQDTIQIGPGLLAVIEDVLEQSATCNDRVIQDILKSISETDRSNEIFDLFFKLFFSHEFFHIDQHLGSDEYKDSDSYMEVVSSVDYQADIAAMTYVLRTSPEREEHAQYGRLLLGIAVHIWTMNAFGRISETDGVSRLLFHRLLVWYFQFSRIVKADNVINLRSASFLAMPILELPAIRAQDSFVRVPAADTLINTTSGTKFDLVVAAPDVRGIQIVARFASTDSAWLSSLMNGVLRGDLRQVRDAFEEPLKANRRLVDLTPSPRVVDDLRIAIDYSEQLLTGNEQLKFGDRQVNAFFDRVDLLLRDTTPPLPGASLEQYRNGFASGPDAYLKRQLLERLGPDWASAVRDAEVSNAILTEVYRLATRLSSALDLLEGDHADGNE